MAGAKEKASTAGDEEEATATAAAMAATAAWNCIVYIWSSGAVGYGRSVAWRPGRRRVGFFVWVLPFDHNSQEGGWATKPVRGKGRKRSEAKKKQNKIMADAMGDDEC